MMLNFDEERIEFTPVLLYTDYINLQFNNFLKKNFPEITPRDFTYISNIFYHQNISQKELSELLYVSESNVTQIIKRLEKNGLIVRQNDETNKCRKIITLTEKAKRILFTLLKLIYEEESKIFSRYSDEEVHAFKRILYDYSKTSSVNQSQIKFK